MGIIVDVDHLLHEGRISRDEYTRLRALAVKETGTLGFNILVGFGVLATAGGALALLPSSATALALGFVLSVAGLVLHATSAKEWGVLGSILLLVGSLTAAGGIVSLTAGSALGFLVVTLLCLAGGVLAKSSMLAALAALALSATVGAATAYSHATYQVVIQQPTVTVVLFGLLAWGAYFLSLGLTGASQRVALVFARTSLFLVNLGFWVGSLWGDSLWNQRDLLDSLRGAVIPDWVFAIGWAVGLIATGLWAVRRNRPWVVNLLAVFGAIHFYTQYFKRLGTAPASILVAGLVALGIALAIVKYNKMFKIEVARQLSWGIGGDALKT